MTTQSSIPAGESHGQRSLVAYSLWTVGQSGASLTPVWGHNESDTTEAT